MRGSVCESVCGCMWECAVVCEVCARWWMVFVRGSACRIVCGECAIECEVCSRAGM